MKEYYSRETLFFKLNIIYSISMCRYHLKLNFHSKANFIVGNKLGLTFPHLIPNA